MPKKFRGTDTRGLKAKAQKAAASAEKSARSRQAQEAAEAANWTKGSDTRGAARRAAAAEKQARLQAAKVAKKEAEDADAAEISRMRKKGKGGKGGKGKGGKVKAAKKLTAFERRMLAEAKKKKAEKEAKMKQAQRGQTLVTSTVLTPNKNKERGDGSWLEAKSLDEAVSILDLASGSSSSANGVDRHPEKRAKAAFMAYKERETIRIRAEYPKLKKSQIDERIFKAWVKSDENPRNQSR